MSRRTGERISTIYWIDGDYIPEAIQEISYFMRDWRRNETKTIDRRTIDIMAASHAMLNTDEPFTMLSGYAARKQTRCCAVNLGQLRKIRFMLKAKLSICGWDHGQCAKSQRPRQNAMRWRWAYSRSNFVHMDCGPVRVWGR